MRRLPAVGVVLGLWLAAGAAAQPQSLSLRAKNAPATAPAVSVDIASTLVPHGRPGPIGWATVSYENPDLVPHRVEISFADWGETVVHRDTVSLAPSERVVRHYALQRWQNAIFPRVRLDREDEVQGNPMPSGTSGIGVLLVTTRAGSTAFVEAMLEPGLGRPSPTESTPGRRVPRSASPKPFGIVDQLPHGLPDRWQCLAGFDLIVVDAGLALGAERERVLLDYVAAGGALLALDAGTLGDGPLRTAIRGGPSGQLGFGRWFAGERARGGDGDRAFAAWVADPVDGLGVAGTRALSGPASDGQHLDLEIPGLGSVPVLAFFVLILVFVIAAGPVNLFLCKRAGRPVLMVLTLPALGFGFAGAILLWGMFSEGLGVKGAVRSITWLDQREHYAVTHATQTLYAGTTQARLTPAPGTLFLCSAVGLTTYRDAGTYAYRVDGAGVVDGDVLPSRTPTTLVGVTAQRSRERLRFKRATDGGLEALVGPGLTLAPEGVVVRDHGGRWFATRPGASGLQPIDAADAGVLVREARGRYAQVILAEGGTNRMRNFEVVMPITRAHGVPITGAQEALQQWLLTRVETLAPGSYLAWADTNATVDGFGLANVEWRGRHHLVLGLLAEEDIVD